MPNKHKRTKFDPNEFIDLENEVTEIVLYNAKHKEVGKAIVNTNIVPILRNYKWYLRHDGYVATSPNTNRVYLHHFIIGKPANRDNCIDHINRNKLDNRVENLRVISQHQNTMNRSLNSNNTSGVKGVFWDKKRQKWTASISYSFKTIYLGRFVDKKAAIVARKKAENKYFEDFAK